MERLNNLASDSSNLREPGQPEPELVSVKTLASIMDAEEKTIRDWILDGKIPYVKLPTGAIRFHLATVRQWYSRGMVQSVRL